ncbi:MAG: preprotein translocase subunit YajC [Rhizobiaceae bacterium]
MFVTPAYAQTAPGAGPDFLMTILPFALILVIMYFMMIRPQRQQMKQREAMLAGIKRGDTVITGGGIVAKVVRVVDDREVEAEIAQGVKITIVRQMISEVRAKGEPANTNVKS